MTDPDPKPEEKGKPEEKEVDEKIEGGQLPVWTRPVLAVVLFLLFAAAAGFGVGYLTTPGDSGPDLTREEAFAQAREQAIRETTREMARRGFDAGRRSGRSHGIIAGGMAAESAVTIVVREQAASAAQADAASAQSELAGMAGSPPPIPDFSSGE